MLARRWYGVAQKFLLQSTLIFNARLAAVKLKHSKQVLNLTPGFSIGLWQLYQCEVVTTKHSTCKCVNEKLVARNSKSIL